MKKTSWFAGLVLMVMLTACNDTAEVQVKINTDSIGNKVDRVKDKIDSTTSRALDTLKEGVNRFTKKVKVKFNEKDSVSH